MSIISADQLHHQVPRPVVLDCRFSLADPHLGRQQYELSHIPNAYYFDLNQDLSGSVAEHGGRHPLPDPLVLAAKFAAAGISALTPVVVYDDGLAFAARCWWLLRYLGHDRVQVLDSGFRAWAAAGYEVTQVIPPPQTGKFEPQVRSHWVVDFDMVQQQVQNPDPRILLIDSREGDRYRGEREPIDPVAGHIPGAENYPWSDMLNDQGCIKPDDAQRWDLADRDCEEIWVYCGSGVTACANLLSLEQAGRSGKLYAGSWSDWCHRPHAQIATA